MRHLLLNARLLPSIDSLPPGIGLQARKLDVVVHKDFFGHEPLTPGDKIYCVHANGVILYSVCVAETPPEKNLSESIHELGLSVHTTNTLKREASVETVGDLVKLTLRDLCKTPSLGRTGIREIVAALAKYRLKLRN
jgi:hypothetical protein